MIHPVHPLHRWDLTPKEAAALQVELRDKIVARAEVGAVRHVAGVDVGYVGGCAHAAVAVLSFPDLQLREQALASVPVSFPYVPGLLTFREGPGVLAAFEKLAVWPDLVLFDGHGYAHPRRFGLASHMGMLLDLPSIGCAKSRLIGHADEPGPDRGDWTPLTDAGQVIGAALRTRPGTRPLYISIGYRVDLETAIHYVLACCTRYRLPETTRWAHRLAGENRAACVV